MTTRRGFLTTLAATPLLSARFVTAAASPSPSPAPSPTAEALAEAASARFGLSPDERKVVLQSISENLSLAEAFRKLKLQNSDEPVTVFRPAEPARTAR